MIQAEGLTKYYGDFPAIQDVSFQVGRGEIMGFLGPNAAGKTTTMRILTGYMPASRGRAIMAGFDIAKSPLEAKRHIGYLPENVPLYGEMTVKGFLTYVARIKEVPGAKIKGEVDRVMERCGLGKMASRIIGNLSKGYRQRTGLAQALLGSPDILILDEPTVGLDPSQIIEIRSLIRELSEEHTILLSSHILPEVAQVCNRVMIIANGRIVVEDALQGLSGNAGQMVLRLRVHGPEDQVLAVLRQQEGVENPVARGKELFSATCSRENDPRVSLARAFVEQGLGLVEMTVEERTLEDVFVETVSRADAAVVARERGNGS